VIAVTGEKCTKETWKQVAEGKYNVVLAAPEAIFEKTGYFWNEVLRKRSGALYSRLIAVAIDECHCVKNWGGTGFRMDYNNIGILREAFLNIPFLGLTATITPTGISYYFKSTKFKRPAIIRQTVRRTNVDIWVAQITGNEHQDLGILIPDDISNAQDIPQTIIFYNGRVGCGRMAKWLRSRLPASLRSEGETVVRNYSGVLDEVSKQETLKLLRNGACRMVVCTDAFGLGMNISAIPRVVVWKLDAKVGIDGLHQRSGRAGRDTDERALALIYVSKANLSGQYVSPTRKVTESLTQTITRKKAKIPKPASPTETQSSTANDDEFRYTLPVSKETEPTFRKALPHIYAGPTKKALGTHSESNLPAAVHWVLQTEGCRQQPFLVAFEDPEMMRACGTPGGCDLCRMRHLMETNTEDSPPTLHGIPFTITLAYQTYLQASNDKPRKTRKQTMHTITTDRMQKLIVDIKTWRKATLDDFAKQFAELTVEIVFPDTKIVALAGKAKNVATEEDLIAALEECGYSIPGSFISSYTEDLYRCISGSLKESHPPPQLQEQFDQAAGRVVKQCLPVEPQASQRLSAISPSTQSTLSIPSPPQQGNQVSSIINPLPQHTATSRVPHWPVPSIRPTSLDPVYDKGNDFSKQ
jgi:Helicase conserved C-terminal domain